MPFVTLAQLEGFVPNALFDELSEEGKFEKFESQSAMIISSETGIDNPASAEDAPEWAAIPTAWLITFLGKHLLTGVSDEYEKSIVANYREAYAYLKKHTTVATALAPDRVFEMGGLFR